MHATQQTPTPSISTPGLCPVKWAAALLVSLAFCLARPADAQTPTGDGAFQIYARRSQLDMVELSTRLVELPDRTKTVDQFDPAVLSIEAVSDRQVRVTALGPGVTTIGFVSESGVVREVEVFVKGDTRHLQAYLRELFPGSNVKAVQVGETGDAVVLRGWVTQPSHIAEIMDIAAELYANPINQMRTATNDRVILECRVMEVNRTKLREFGFDFLNFGSTVRVGSLPGQLTPQGLFRDSGGLNVAEGILSAPSLALQVIKPGYQFLGFLQALQTESLAKILAEPRLTVTSGRPADLLSGGEFPILVPQGIGNSTIEFRSFGVRVKAVAVVLGNNRLRLDIEPEVSERDFSSSITLSGVQVPGLTTRRVSTSAELGFGETLMLGGLVSTRDIGSTSKVPFLGELPYIGMAFSKKRYEQSETELLIMVTPYPAGTVNPEMLPPGPGRNTMFPNDNELYLDGLLEVPNYGEPCSDQNPNCGPGYHMPQQGFNTCPSGECGSDYRYEMAPTASLMPSAMPPSLPTVAPQTMPTYNPDVETIPMLSPEQTYDNESRYYESTPTQPSFGQPIQSPASQPAQMDFDSPGTAEPIPAQPQMQPMTDVRRPRMFRRNVPAQVAPPQIVQTSAQQPASQPQAIPQPAATSAPAAPARRSVFSRLRSQY